MNPERRDVLFFMLQHQQNQLIQGTTYSWEKKKKKEEEGGTEH